MKWIVEDGGKLTPADEYYARKAGERAPMVVNDIQPFRLPGPDGEVIGSRKHLRDYERAHGVRQIGNDLNGYYRDRLGVDLPR
jgi:hypothetical protein